MKNDKRTTLMISGYYGFGNAGDEAILAAMLQQFRENIDDPKIIVLSENPSATAKEFGVETCDRKDYNKIFHLMNDIDVFISGGGGLVQDSTGFATVLYYLGLISMARMRGKKTMMYAQGFGPLAQNKSRLVAKFVINGVNLITFRDEGSKALANEIGITKPPIHITADPVFSLHPPAAEILDPIAEAEEINPGDFKLGISVRPWETGADYVEMIAAVADSFAKEKKAKIFIFPFQDIQDLDVCRKVQEKMEHPSRIVLRAHSIPVMLGLMGKMDLIIGMRLHSLIFSLIQGVPSVGISYDPKVKSLMERMELPSIDIASITKRDIQDAAEMIYMNRNPLREHILARCSQLREKAGQNVELLKELIRQ